MIDIILDTLIDSLKLIPFLFIAFLIIELIEHKLQDKTKKIVSESGKLGPLIGGCLGILPQCGFSVIATNLYITRIISLGTLIAVYLATSDEMLPILLANQVSFKLIGSILLIKFLIGMIVGYIIDFIFRKKNCDKVNYEICDEDHCGCHHEHSIIKSSVIHTLKTIIFLTILMFIINILFEYLGSHYLANLFLKDSLFAPFITSLIGLIPNCGASIMITELYLKEAISFGSMIGGLLTGSGVALLVLFKANKNLKENIGILSIVYLVGVGAGIVLDLLIKIV